MSEEDYESDNISLPDSEERDTLRCDCLVAIRVSCPMFKYMLLM